TGSTDILGGTAECDGLGSSGTTTVHGVLAGAGAIGSLVDSGLGSRGSFDATDHLMPATLTVDNLDLSGLAPKFLIAASAYGRLAVRGSVQIGGTNGIDVVTAD